MKISIGLEQQLQCNILLPITIGTIIILITTLYPLNTSIKNWKTTTYDYIYNSGISTTETKILYMKNYLNEYFSLTENNINIAHDYIQCSANNTLNVIRNYKNYFSVNTFAHEIPQKDVNNYYFSSASFVKNINNINDLKNVDQYTLNDSTIYDNVMRAIFKSSNLYTTIYFGFEKNGFHRRYPYSDLTSFVSFTSTCYYNNQPIATFDPRCREWYVVAKYDNDIHYSSPYVNALSGDVSISASKRVMNGTNLLGVFGIDFSMNQIDEIVNSNNVMKNGYMFLMTKNGALISHPNLNRNLNPNENVITMESKINSNVWTNMFQKENDQPFYIKTVDTDQKNWIILYVYMEKTNYYVVMMYPESDVTEETNDIFNNLFKIVLNGTIILPIISGITLLFAFVILNTIGKHYTFPIRQLLKDVKQIGTAELDIELGNRAPVSAEFSALQHNFANLLTAVKFGNDAYYGGNMQKALESYENAEKLMTTLKINRGLSVCYNNKANVYKQMGKFTEAEEFYLKSISIVNKLIDESTDNSTILAYKVSLSYKLMNLGVLYKDSQKIEQALEHFAKSIKLARETDNALGISKISGNLAQLYIDVYPNNTEKIKEAKELIYDAYETIKDKEDSFSLQYSQMNIGIYEKTISKQYEVALEWFTHVLKNHETVDAYVKQTCLKHIYEILMLLKRTSEASQIYTETKQLVSNDVLFVLDCSGSMAGQFINTCKTSVKNIVINYLQDTDNISMTTFNNKITKIFENESKQNLGEILTKINDIKADGGTAFYDALYDSINNINDKSNHVKWIVALTDGDDQHSNLKPHVIMRMLKQKSVNIVIMTVGKLKNANTINQICKSVKHGNKGIFIEIDKNSDKITEAFSKVAKLIVGQLNVESL